MAVTQGHGNPDWNRDETILALDVYFSTHGRNPSAKAPQIIALSEMLRSLPYHGEEARRPTFRNPDGAAFKLQNLRSLETGKGLGNVSRMDRDLWAEFGDSPVEVSRLANLIRHQVKANQLVASSSKTENEIEFEFYEGRLITQQHFRRERNPGVRRKLLQWRSRTGRLSCDICEQTYETLPAELREAAFEAHHVISIATVGEGVTRLSDIALLCATCHRLIHRAIALKKDWVGIQEARDIIHGPSPGVPIAGAPTAPNL